MPWLPSSVIPSPWLGNGTFCDAGAKLLSTKTWEGVAIFYASGLEKRQGFIITSADIAFNISAMTTIVRPSVLKVLLYHCLANQ